MTAADPEAFAATLAEAVGEAHVQRIPTEAGHPPAWQVSPGASAEVAEVVRRCDDARVAVLPVGSGARPTRWRGLAGRSRVHVALRRMDHVVHLDETSLLVHAQAGVTGMALEQVLAPRGLSLGDYPASVLGSTVGGMLAVRTPGKSSARHGFLEDAVAGVSAVLADGRTLHTRVAPRRSTGPDLGRALCGSEGTLAVITSAVLRIHRRAEARFLAASWLPSVERALAAAYLAMREECTPAGLRICDAAEARAQFGDAAGGVPWPDAALLLAATAGPTDLAACDRDLLASAVSAEGGAPAPVALAEAWWKVRGGATSSATPPNLQVTATPGRQAAVYRAVVEAARRAGGDARAHVSRFDADGAVLFATVSGGDVARAAAERAAADAGGYLLGTRARQLDPYLAALRAALDPHGIMNPGALSGDAPETSPGR